MSRERRIGVVETSQSAAGGPLEAGAFVSLTVDAATQAEASRITEVLSEAFLDDPTWSWAFPDPAARKQWWSFCVREALRYPRTFKTEGYEAVSVWIPLMEQNSRPTPNWEYLLD